ncbi:MAG: CHASE2 domain-containing protein [Deltaproteobacteria bacterium]|nr:CHASE2 domain-containing protein [Deltaproteobacteria bacterium]
MALKIRSRRRLAAASSGLFVGLFVLALSFLELVPTSFDEMAYDALMRATADETRASDRIVLVHFDEESLGWVEREMGEEWPWPREYHGILLSTLRSWGARVVAFDILFDQDRVGHFGWSDTAAFTEHLREAGQAVLAGGHNAGERAPIPARGHGIRLAAYPDWDAALEGAGRLTALARQAYLQAEGEGYRLWVGGFDSDEEARAAVTAWGTAVLPLLEKRPETATRVDRAALSAWLAEVVKDRAGEVPEAAEHVGDAEFLRRFRLSAPSGEAETGVDTLPQAPFLLAAAGFGIAEQLPDSDGILRRMQLTARLESGVYPSFPLAIYLAAQKGHVPVQLGKGKLVVGDQKVPVDAEDRVRVRLHGVDPYDDVPAWKVLRAAILQQEGQELDQAELDPARFADRIVIMSGSAVSLMDRRPSSLSQSHNGSDLNAAMVDALIAGCWVRRAPGWLMALSTLLMGIFAALLGAFATEPRPLARIEGALGSILRLATRGVMAGVAIAVVIGPLLVVAVYLFGSFDFWVPVALPILTAGGALITALGVLEYVEYRDRRAIHQALGIYTSDLVANLVATGGVKALDARRDDVSVYFSDLEGFTSFSENLEPEQLSALLSDYLTAMTDVILEHEGVVDKYIGDAIMAFWGWRETQPDHPLRAVRCAAAMRSRMAELRPVWEERYGVVLKARAGINSGIAVVGNMGSAQKMNVTLLGDVVNLAARLEGANKAYGTELMVGEATYEEAKAGFEFRELDILRVKGKAKPVRVYEPLVPAGEVNGDLRWRDSFESGLAAFREADFSAARAHFEEVLTLRPGDAPAKLYLERCAAYAAAPPPADWDGVYVMTTK